MFKLNRDKTSWFVGIIAIIGILFAYFFQLSSHENFLISATIFGCWMTAHLVGISRQLLISMTGIFTAFIFGLILGWVMHFYF